jgi:IS5 family transposase
VEASHQRNSKDENGQIKKEQMPESFAGNHAKQTQKDTDSRWTKKNNHTYYSYKNPCEARCKIIIKYEVTDASVHDRVGGGPLTGFGKLA